jgi:prolyl-tRNA synthetase
MGCYGIGITRLPAAAIEQNHDERGIIWPDAIAPFTVVICPDWHGPQRSGQDRGRKAVCRFAGRGVDVMLDDRGERPGAMFADWELIGVPHRVVIWRQGPEGRPWSSTSTAATPAATKVAVADVFAFREGAHGRMTR